MPTETPAPLTAPLTAPLPAYDPDNVFAKILRGEIPAHRVYEDAHTLAFMDVMPQGEGHTLVIPKAPARGLLDADPEALCALVRSVQVVGRAVKAAFGIPADRRCLGTIALGHPAPDEPGRSADRPKRTDAVHFGSW